MTAAPDHRLRPPTGWVRAAAVAATAAAVLLALGGCSGGDTVSSRDTVHPARAPMENGSADSGGGAQPNAARPNATAPAGVAAAPGSAGSAGSAAMAKARLIRTAQVTIEISGQLTVAVAQVKQVAKRFGGQVEAETTGLGDTARNPGRTGTSDGSPRGAGGGSVDSSGSDHRDGSTARPGESMIVLRVPEPRLDDAIAAVTAVHGGKVLSQTSSAQDVTGDIADLTSRVASQRASLDRVRALMARATSLQDVVTLESELSRRQADLEALESRLAALSDQADLSTLTVLLRTPAAEPAPDEPDTGFLAGLASGWHALKVSTSAVLTLLGALLPVAAVLAVPGWLLVRSLRRRALRRPGVPPATNWPHGGAPGQPGPGQPGPGWGGPGWGGPGWGGGPDSAGPGHPAGSGGPTGPGGPGGPTGPGSSGGPDERSSSPDQSQPVGTEAPDGGT